MTGSAPTPRGQSAVEFGRIVYEGERARVVCGDARDVLPGLATAAERLAEAEAHMQRAEAV